MKTDHSFGKKMALLFEAVYNALNLLFSWFGYALAPAVASADHCAGSETTSFL